ncbi:hypothetical protein CDAR_547841 [Caerostris darwini]|uniref:Uncharacterized protein n=1 Tax=Caerostris darwini TaxID=1538125 RepID=A0AAV4WH54_9ARAC|nr:hypothetical protein CDAR_547841 [Caerostris darwini]
MTDVCLRVPKPKALLKLKSPESFHIPNQSTSTTSREFNLSLLKELFLRKGCRPQNQNTALSSARHSSNETEDEVESRRRLVRSFSCSGRGGSKKWKKTNPAHS